MIKVYGHRSHSKASERYIDVNFFYEDGEQWHGSVPIEYRRTGTDLKDELEIQAHLLQAYNHCRREKREQWLAEQATFWTTKLSAKVTKPIFDPLTSFRWCCTSCDLPANSNPQRRIQALKEMGYTIATNTKQICDRCQKRRTHHILVPLPRGGISGYETWPPQLRKKIMSLLNTYDVYEARTGSKDNLLPDHKFPEIRWDAQTKRASLEGITEEQIKNDFQLMSNQRNQQKREVCRTCYQTGKRGYPFGIKFYYQGDENWPAGVPKRGKEAEQGCVGCGWYDMKQWRETLNQKKAQLSKKR